MNEKVIDKAFGYIDSVAQKLGVAAEHVWPLMIKQQVVGGITDLFFGVVLAVAAYLLIRQAMKDLTTYEGSEERGLVLSFLGGIAAIFAFFCIYFSVGPIINPEYYAIQEILEVIKGD
jgi:hypothetical protein